MRWGARSCGDAKVKTPDEKGCVDRDECLTNPCLNGGVCINREPFYLCDCPDGYFGENCQFLQQGQIVRLSMGALAAILVCLLVILSESTAPVRSVRVALVLVELVLEPLSRDAAKSREYLPHRTTRAPFRLYRDHRNRNPNRNQTPPWSDAFAVARRVIPSTAVRAATSTSANSGGRAGTARRASTTPTSASTSVCVRPATGAAIATCACCPTPPSPTRPISSLPSSLVWPPCFVCVHRSTDNAHTHTHTHTPQKSINLSI